MLINSSTDMPSALLDATSGSGVVSQVLLLGKSLLVFRSHFFLVFSSDYRLGGADMLGVEGLAVLNGLDSVLKWICKPCVMIVGMGKKDILEGGGHVAHGRPLQRSQHVLEA